MATEPYIGQIQPFPYNFAPRGWADCAGQIMSIAQNTALFSLLGTTYGGNGQTTFGLPDFRSRAMVGGGMGNGPGLTPISLGELGGSESVTLTAAQLPVHTHTATATSTLYAEGGAGSSANPANKLLAGLASLYIAPDPNVPNKAMAPEAVTTTVTNAAAGGSQPFDNRQPYLGIRICIALEGIFPSRN